MQGSAQIYHLAQDTPGAHPFEATQIIGDSVPMRALLGAIGRISRSPCTVLITGESGTGKELAARALHHQSPRAHRPFIALNMAAIPKDLLESELFGHERGAFTGAHARRPGRFEQADGGTLFLDEIGDMPTELQTRLLRVLADREFFPVGARSPIRVDVRIITATHRRLEAQVARGCFREDLFHRLNVLPLHLPPLRERRQDIPLLLRHYLTRASKLLSEETKVLAPETEDYLCNFNWPGNVRQLENVCHWIAAMVAGRMVGMQDLPPELHQGANGRPDFALGTNTVEYPPEPEMQEAHSGGQVSRWDEALFEWAVTQLNTGKSNVAKESIAAAERILISAALLVSRGNRNLAAQRLGYGRNTLARKIKELGLLVEM